MANAGIDNNRNTTLLVQSSVLATTLLNLTSTPIANVNPLNVAIVDGSGVQITSFGGGTQYADGAARGTATGTLLMVDDGTLIQSAAGTAAGLLKIDLSGTAANATAIKVDGSAVTQPISGSISNTSFIATQGTGTNLHMVVDSGTVTTVTTVTTVSAVTSITNALPAGNNNIGDVDILTINGQAPAFGTGTRSASTQRVTIATDDIVPVSQSGTWTVQPGNTANTTPWLVSAKIALTASSPVAASVGVASAQAVASNANRKGLVLVNTSSSTISLGFGSAAVLNSGITLNANGGTFIMDEFMFNTGAVNAIASSASSNLSIQEYT